MNDTEQITTLDLRNEIRRLRGQLDDAAGYLAAIHRHANRHDVLGADLACAGCALLERIEATESVRQHAAADASQDGGA